MPFPVKTFSDIQGNILRDISNKLPEADTGPDSDYAIRANANASAIEGLYEHQQWIYKQIFPDSADPDNLALHARTRGLSKKLAVPAQGTIQVTGLPGAPITGALLAQTLDGRQYQTSGTGTIGANGTLSLNAMAVTAGSAGSVDPTVVTTLTLFAPPPGVNAVGTVVSIVGGTDDETDAELLARLLDVIRHPPAGGNQYDYRRWAMNVAGVSAAYVYPLRRGLGTCDVVITSSGGLPSATTIAATQAAIDSQRPVTAKGSMVIAPTIVTLDHVVQVAMPGYTQAQAQAAVQPGIAGYFAALIPGAKYVKSQVEGIITDTPGITDRLLVTPASNVVPEADANAVQWLQLGNLTVSLMQ